MEFEVFKTKSTEVLTSKDGLPPDCKENGEAGITNRGIEDEHRVTVKDEQEGSDLTFQYFLELVGTTGPWNYMVFVLCAMCSFNGPLQALAYQFLGDTPEYWCSVPELIQANWTQQQIRNLAIPVNNKTEEEGSCYMHNYNYSLAVHLGYEESLLQLDLLTISDKDIQCKQRQFNLTDVQSTTVTEWDLVCDRRFLYSTTFSASFLVRLITSPFTGYIGDTIGRRSSIVGGGILYVPTCFLAAASPSYEIYIILRILIAFFDSFIYMGGFVLCLELSGKDQRSMVGVLFCIPWALGYMLMPGIAYMVREWRLLQVCLSLPTLYLITYYWLLPESPRWLVTKGRCQEALQVLKKAAKMNGKVIDDQKVLAKLHQLQSQESITEEPKSCLRGLLAHAKEFVLNLWQLVRSLPLLRLTVVVMFTWFSSAATYYGVSLNSVNLSTNTYIYMFLGGLLELPSYILLWPVASILGRKRAFITLFVVCGVSMSMIPVLDEFAPSAPGALKVTFSLLGKVAINMAFQLAYLYTGELYHTSQRAFVISLGSIFSAAGGALAPYINDLLVQEADWGPSVTFTALSIVAAILTITLPETKGEELPDNVKEVQNTADNTLQFNKKDT